MSPTRKRRRKSESSVESTTCDSTSFLETFINASLPVKNVCYKILQKRGPFTISQLLEECRKAGKLNSTKYSVGKALNDLKALNLVVKVNGGWAIHNWNEIGKD